MGSLTKYSGLTTKVRAMRGKLLKKQDFDRLSELSRISEFVDNLKKRENFADIFADVNPEDIHRGNLEKLLTYGIYRDFSKIYRFSNIDQRKFLKLYFIKYEVTMLKRAIRGLNYKDNLSYYDMAEVIFNEFSDIDIESVYSATSISEIIEALKGTIYYDVLLKVSQYEDSTTFDYEMALDMFFFKFAWKKRKSFDAKEMKLIAECLGTEIDALNIMWVYRAKKNYNLEKEDIYNIIIPIHYKISKEEFKNMLESGDLDEFNAIVGKTSYGKYVDEKYTKNSSIDKTYKMVLARLYNKFFKLNPYSVACINAYLYEKNEEMLKLITLAECIRYGYKKDAISEEIL